MSIQYHLDGWNGKSLRDKIISHEKMSCGLINALDDCGVQGGVTVKGLKAVTGFNKGQMAELLVDFYQLTRTAMELVTTLQTQELKTQAKCFELEEKVKTKASKGEALTLENMRGIVKEELTGAVQDLESKMKQSKELTEKRWSDLFKSNKDDLKIQKKQATKQRIELEKTLADNKRKTVVDNLERQKRASNICVNNVAESNKTDKKEKYEDECDTVIGILQLNAEDVKHVFRAGSVRDKPRPLICVLTSPELANQQHSHGKGRAIRDDEGKKILYWVNPDFIKTDRVANFKARLAKSKNSDTDKANAERAQDQPAD